MKRIVFLVSVLITILLWNVAFAESCAPQNPIWKQGSTATATWDGIESADYS